MSERIGLLQDVFECMRCDGLDYPFEKSPDGRYYRFPPVIGGTNGAKVLFVGINPRISRTNRGLHQTVTGSVSDFAALAANRYKGLPYIYPGCEERHYRPHAAMIQKLQPNSAFEEIAAATELYCCASAGANGLDLVGCSCAKLFMPRVFRLLRPLAVVAVGQPVVGYLRSLATPGPATERVFQVPIGGHTSVVVPVPHPNSRGERSKVWDWATEEVARILGLSGTSTGETPVDLSPENSATRN